MTLCAVPLFGDEIAGVCFSLGKEVIPGMVDFVIMVSPRVVESVFVRPEIYDEYPRPLRVKVPVMFGICMNAELNESLFPDSVRVPSNPD